MWLFFTDASNGNRTKTNKYHLNWWNQRFGFAHQTETPEIFECPKYNRIGFIWTGWPVKRKLAGGKKVDRFQRSAEWKALMTKACDPQRLRQTILQTPPLRFSPLPQLMGLADAETPMKGWRGATHFYSRIMKDTLPGNGNTSSIVVFKHRKIYKEDVLASICSAPLRSLTSSCILLQCGKHLPDKFL